MKISIQIDGENFRIDAANPLDISIPLDFNGAQPNAYGVEKASSKPCAAGELVGDTRRGGSCNFEEYKIIPHCNGTHTESIGHITHERMSVREHLRDAFIPATLISVAPEKFSESGESYAIGLEKTEKLITRKSLEDKISNVKNDEWIQALIVRILPNNEDKLSKTYLKEIPPFFSTEAMNFLIEFGVKHLLVDLPSIDRIFDEGKLSNHRTFWNVEAGAFEINENSFVNNTITELIYVSDEIEDGNYLLNLQIAPFAADASPSRPILFKIL